MSLFNRGRKSSFFLIETISVIQNQKNTDMRLHVEILRRAFEGGWGLRFRDLTWRRSLIFDLLHQPASSIYVNNYDRMRWNEEHWKMVLMSGCLIFDLHSHLRLLLQPARSDIPCQCLPSFPEQNERIINIWSSDNYVSLNFPLFLVFFRSMLDQFEKGSQMVVIFMSSGTYRKINSMNILFKNILRLIPRSAPVWCWV